jgi:hypothetical protein
VNAAIVLLLAILAAPAWAAPSAVQEREAREHYQRGMERYALRDFDAAINEFKTAYSLTLAPALLFNLGQASRLGKRPEEALHFYRTYLRFVPDAPNRSDAERFIASLEPMLRARQLDLSRVDRRSDSVGPPTVGSGAPEPVVAMPRRPVSWRPELASGIVLIGCGAALLGGGIALGVSAEAAQSRIVSAAVMRGTWTPELRTQWNNGERDANGATALYVVGGAAALTGVVLTAVGASRRASLGRWSIAPISGGAHAAWAYAF